MTIHLKTASWAAIAAFAASAAAAQPPPPNSNPAAVPAGVYAIEPLHTEVLFKINHMGFTNYYGSFSGASGTLRLDPAHPEASSLDVSIPVGSVDVASPKLEGELKSADWLDPTKFPVATFHSTKVTPTTPGHALVAGDLTLHGVTRPVTFEASFNAGGPNIMNKAYTAGFEVTGHIQRSQFGVAKYVPLVGDDVTLIISAAFERQPS
jgi:polyisoprenoid-binding protein YceI